MVTGDNGSVVRTKTGVGKEEWGKRFVEKLVVIMKESEAGNSQGEESVAANDKEGEVWWLVD